MADIVLKDRNGNDMPPFEGVGSIKVYTEDGGEETYINGKPVEKTVEPNFAGGDMVVLPENGQVFSKVNILKPANLKPTNIVKDVEIAGIVGTSEGGSGSEEAEFVALCCTADVGAISSSSASTVKRTVSVPEKATLLCVRKKAATDTISSSAVSSKSITELDNYTGYTRSGDTITITHSLSTHYPVDICVILSEIRYICPGVFIKRTEDGVTLYADSTAECCGQVSAIYPPVNEVDFSNSNITSIVVGFKYCTNLTSALLPPVLTAIIDYTFYNCTNLTSITIPSSVTSIGAYAFHKCTSLTSVNILGSVTSIGTYAFYGCTNLTSINIPSGVTSIAAATFYNCTNLTSINIPSGVTSIGASAFNSCTNLTSINIPSSVTSIATNAFNNCTNLALVDLSECISVPTLGTNNFNKKPTGFEIRVPASLYDSFAAATNWSALASYMVAV